MQAEVDRTGGWTVGAINVLKRDIANQFGSLTTGDTRNGIKKVGSEQFDGRGQLILELDGEVDSFAIEVLVQEDLSSGAQ